METKLKVGHDISFYLPEIVSVEIHSVLGKHRRGGNREQQEQCDRDILGASGKIRCANTCVFPAQSRMKDKVFRDLQKLLKDIEDQKGEIKATILRIGPAQFAIAKRLLVTYCDRLSFGSHDAMVAASALNAMTTMTLALTVVTRDKGLKTLCGALSMSTYDPFTDELLEGSSRRSGA